MGLIDGVIQAGSQFGVQCLQAVTNLTGIATSAGGTSFNSAADLAQWAKDTGHLLSTPTPGDIAVWGAGQGGASESGHAGIVTGLGGGGVQVTSTNWPHGQGETQYTVGQGNNPIGMGNPLGYIDPTTLGGKNIIFGTSAVPSGSGGTQAVLTSSTASASSTGSGCQSLSEILASNAHGSSIPVVGGVIGAVTGTALAPVAIVEWGLQPCVRWSAAFWFAALIGGGLAFYLLFRQQANSAMSKVASVAG